MLLLKGQILGILQVSASFFNKNHVDAKSSSVRAISSVRATNIEYFF